MIENQRSLFVAGTDDALSLYSQVTSQVLGGAFGRIASDATAVGDRSGSAVYNIE
jgi:hypothetical protein